jgi:Mn2+/Fe2+ NRAMP family transporter
MLAGVAANFAGLDPMRALFWSAVLNGVVATPLLAIMIWLAARRRVMGEFTIGLPLKIGGWIAAALMSASVTVMGVTTALDLVR